MGERKKDYHAMVNKIYGKPTTREAKDMLTAVHWLLDGNVPALSRCDPYLWYLRGGMEKVLDRADRERKKNL